MKVFLFFLLILSLTSDSSAFIEKLFDRFSFKNQCPIKLYNPKDSSFTGLKIYANAETFHPLLETLSSYAKECHVKINIKQSFIQENFERNKMISNERTTLAFQLGEAIQFELVDKHNKIICNEFCMKKSFKYLKHISKVKCFLKRLSKNSDLQQDSFKRTILMKRTSRRESSVKLEDKRKELQNKCRKLKIDSKTALI